MTTLTETTSTTSKSGRKYGLIALGTLIALAALGKLVAPPEPVEKAIGDLVINYKQQSIYNPVACDAKEIGPDWFVLCRQNTAATIGGLYHIALSGEQYYITPINGKARQHTERGGLTVYEKQKRFDVPVILAEY